MTKIGIICYDTQYEQICNQIYDENYSFSRIEVSDNESRFKRIWKFIKQIKKVDYVYYGHGEAERKWQLKLLVLFKKKIVMHWIGSDVLSLNNNLDMIDFLNKNVIIHFGCSKNIVNELQNLGINAIELPIIPKEFNIKLMEAPKQHAALFYLPDDKEDFYGVRFLKLLSKNFRDISFYVVGNTKYDFSDCGKNIINMGKLSKEDMNKLYSKISILVRIPEHDGLSLMLLETLLRGKQVIYKYDYPYVTEYKNDKQLIDDFGKIVSEKPIANSRGRDYVLNNYKLEELKEKFYSSVFDRKE